MARKANASAAVQTTTPVLSVVQFEEINVQPTKIAPVTSAPSIEISDPQNVLQSKRYVKGVVDYPSPGEMLQPVLDVLRTANGKLILTGGNEQNNANTDGSLNVSYGRLNLVSRFDIDKDYFYEVGILIAYDLQIPKIKIYTGAKVSACMNLCIFQADDVVKFDIANGINIALVQTFLNQLTARIAKVHEVVARLKGITISPEVMEAMIGRMMVQTVSKKMAHGTTTILSGLDTLLDDRSKYYYKQADFNAWLFFNSFTEYMEKRVNFFDIPDKARDIFKLVADVCSVELAQIK